MIKKFNKLSNKSLIIIILILLCVFIFNAWLFCYIVRTQDTGYKFINPNKYITLAEYKGLTYETQPVEVTDEDVKEEINARRNEKAVAKSVKEGTIKEGDTVIVDYTGTIDGKEFNGSSSTDQEIAVGSGMFIKEFEDRLVGKKIGEKISFSIAFPKDYDQKEVAGKTVKYKVKVTSKNVMTIPEYNNEFIAEDTDGKYKSKEEYEAYIRDFIEKKNTEEETQKEKDMLWQEVVSKTKVSSYPEAQTEKEKEQIVQQYKALAKEYDVSWEEFLSEYLGTTEEKFDETLKSTAQASVKEKLITMAIARAEKISISEKEYEDSLKEVLKEAELTKEEFEKEYGMTLDEYAEKYDIRNILTKAKVVDLIYKNAKPVSGGEYGEEYESEEYESEKAQEEEKE